MPQPDTTPAPSLWQTLWQDFVAFLPKHISIVALCVAVAASVIGVNYIRDLRAKLAEQAKITSTLAEKFQQIGGAAVTGNTLGTKTEVDHQALDAFGVQVQKLMRQQDAKINSLTTAVAIAQAQVTELKQQPTVFPVQSRSTSGALTGYTMEESRNGGPPLASVRLSYDPTATDPSKAFAGTVWTHYRELFKTSTGSWEKKKDGGYATTVSLTRTVSKPDPDHPGEYINVGTEQIPVTEANTIYSPAGLTEPRLVLPRWTLELGISNAKTFTNTAASTPYVSIDYRFTKRFGVFAGTSNGGIHGGISIRLGVTK